MPGLLKEKVRALAKAMPQRLRHKLGALDEFADAFAAQVEPRTRRSQPRSRATSAPSSTSTCRSTRSGPTRVPPHLRMNFRVLDDQGRQRAMGRDLAEIKRELGEETQAVLQDEAPVDEGARYTGWTMGDLPEIMEIERGGRTLVGYPALVDAGDAVTLQVFDSPEKAREAHAAGVRRLLAIAFRDRIRDLERTLAKDIALAPLKDDIVARGARPRRSSPIRCR